MGRKRGTKPVVSQAYNGLKFSISDLLQSARAFKNLSSSFLSSSWGLDEWVRALENIKRHTSSQGPIELRLKEGSLKSRVSKGAYEPGQRKGSHLVWAQVSSIWEVYPESPRRPKAIILKGKASTKVELFEKDDSDPERLLAQWQVEVGHVDSPGTHFHVGVLQREGVCVFPKSLSVPRLPSLLITPLDALDFTLGELFQDKWARAAVGSCDARTWGNQQKKRLVSLLNWYHESISNSSGSAWMALKGSRPTDLSFC